MNGAMRRWMGRRPRVRLENELEAMAWQWGPTTRRRMARMFYRWAKQLWLSADILEADERRYGPTIHWVPPWQQDGN